MRDCPPIAVTLAISIGLTAGLAIAQADPQQPQQENAQRMVADRFTSPVVVSRPDALHAELVH